jgi:hypothetical protein
LSADSESEKILPIGKLMAELSSFEYAINSAFFHYYSGKKKGLGRYFNIFGLLSSRATNPQKISFLDGSAHFVTYGDGLVDNNNALTSKASVLKSINFSLILHHNVHMFAVAVKTELSTAFIQYTLQRYSNI